MKPADDGTLDDPLRGDRAPLRQRVDNWMVRVTGRGPMRWINALYPPNLIHILKNVNTDRLCYERKFLAEQHVGRNEWAVIFPHGMGDLYLACAFAEEVLKQRGGDGFAVFVRPQLSYIPTLFPAVTRIVPVSDFNLARIQQNHHFEKGRLFSVFPLHQFLRVIGYKDVDFLDYYCLFLELDLGTRPGRPRAQTAVELEAGRKILLEHRLRPGRTVVLAPQARSSAVIPAAFWAELAQALRHRGYDVAINHPGGKAAPFPAAVPLDVPIDRFIGTACAAGSVVAMRSGLCELVAHAECHLTVLYREDVSQEKRRLARGFSLASSGLRPDTIELWYTPESGGDVIRRVVDGLPDLH